VHVQEIFHTITLNSKAYTIVEILINSELPHNRNEAKTMLDKNIFISSTWARCLDNGQI
jgi:hypothetical protein